MRRPVIGFVLASVLGALCLCIPGCAAGGNCVRPWPKDRVDEVFNTDLRDEFKSVEYPIEADQFVITEEFLSTLDTHVLVHGVDGTLRRAFEVTPPETLEEVLQDMEMDPNVTGLTRRNVVRLLDRMAEMKLIYDDEAPIMFPRAVERGDVDFLCVALQTVSTRTLRANAADALRQLRHPDSIKTLGLNVWLVQGGVEGGLGDQYDQEQLRIALNKAAAATLGFELCDPCDSSPEQVIAVAERIAQWLEEHQPQEEP